MILGHKLPSIPWEPSLQVRTMMLFCWLNAVNRQSVLHNISVLCPYFATTLRTPMVCLFNWGEIASTEGTTQGDPLAMAMHALAVTPLVHFLQQSQPRCFVGVVYWWCYCSWTTYPSIASVETSFSLWLNVWLLSQCSKDMPYSKIRSTWCYSECN